MHSPPCHCASAPKSLRLPEPSRSTSSLRASVMHVTTEKNFMHSWNPVDRFLAGPQFRPPACTGCSPLHDEDRQSFRFYTFFSTRYGKAWLSLWLSSLPVPAKIGQQGLIKRKQPAAVPIAFFTRRSLCHGWRIVTLAFRPLYCETQIGHPSCKTISPPAVRIVVMSRSSVVIRPQGWLACYRPPTNFSTTPDNQKGFSASCHLS